MGLFDNIKKDIKKSAASKGKMIYLKAETSIRIRFLQKFETGLEVTMHDSFDDGITSICYEHVGKSCSDKIHNNKDVRTRTQYAWSVWDIEAKEVKILMFAANAFTPVPHLASFFNNYHNITDRDYVIERNAKGKGYNVIPMDKATFMNTKAKPFSKEQTFKYIYEANHLEEDDNEVVADYASMTAKALYDLCKEKEIEAETRKSVDTYIALLEAFDAEQGTSDDWDDEPTGDDWGDESAADDGWGDEPAEPEVDYSGYSAKELYNMCIEKEIDAPKRKDEAFYIKLLNDDDMPW